jgi:hypothetical protein
MPTDRSHLAPIAPTMTRLIAPGQFVLRPQLLTRLKALLRVGRSRRSPSALQRSRTNTEAVPRRPATPVVQLFQTATSGHDRGPAMPPKCAQENILPHHLCNTVHRLQNFLFNALMGG